MRTVNAISVATLSGVLALAIGSTAFGDEGVEVRVTNDGTSDLVVTVYDLNTRPKRVVLENAHINGFTNVTINVVGDASGRAKLAWTATSVDSASPRCGHDTVVLGDTAALNVHADSSCNT